MSDNNEVTQQQDTYIDERDPYAAYAQEVNTRAFSGDLLRFTKHGQYKAGVDQEIIPMGTKMFVYMPSLKRGWVKWAEGQPVEHIMGLVSEAFAPPKRDELGDLNEDEWETLDDRPVDPWQPTNHLVMCNTKGEIYTFVTSSKGGLSEIGRVAEMYANRRRMKPDEIPVIELQGRSYDHKLYGETMAPVFKIIGWVGVPQTFMELNQMLEDESDETLVLEELMEAPDEQEPEPEPEPAPRRTTTQQRTTRAAPQKPTAQRAAPQKPAGKAAPQKGKPAQKALPAPVRGGKGGGNGNRRSPRL